MATDPAPPPGGSGSSPRSSSGWPRSRPCGTTGPGSAPSVADRFDRAVQALRPAVDRWPPDVDQVQAALRKLPPGDPPPEKAAQVRYLTGSAYVALAEAAPASPEAAEWWALALRDLEAVPPKALPLNDQKKLDYRLARTLVPHAGGRPEADDRSADPERPGRG